MGCAHCFDIEVDAKLFKIIKNLKKWKKNIL